MVTFSDFITAKEDIETYLLEQGTSFTLTNVTLDSGRILESLANVYDIQGGVQSNTCTFTTKEVGFS